MTGEYSYDLIADVYATDMGRSMPFDDVGWYAAVAAQRDGRVLELGCGTGRITIELAARGLDVFGVDRSHRMLARARRDARARSIELAVAQMDMRTPALHGPFATILLPYSLVTYVVDPVEAAAMLRTLRDQLAPGGAIVLDAFVPRPTASFADFRRDYRRAHETGFLEREKRIAAQPDGTSIIERRYSLLDADGEVTQTFTTRDHIRPYAPAELRRLAEAADLTIVMESHDYAHCPDPGAAQFHSLVAVRGMTG